MSTPVSRPAPSKHRRRRYTQAQLEAQFAAQLRAAERREVLKATAVLTAARKQFQAGIADRRKGVEEPSQLPDPRTITPEQRARLDVKAAVDAGALGLSICRRGHSLADAAETPTLLLASGEWRLCLLCFPESSWPPFPSPVPPRNESGPATHAEALAEDYERAMTRWHLKRAGIELKYAARAMFDAAATVNATTRESANEKMNWPKKGPDTDADAEASRKARERMAEIEKPVVTRLTTTTPIQE